MIDWNEFRQLSYEDKRKAIVTFGIKGFAIDHCYWCEDCLSSGTMIDDYEDHVTIVFSTDHQCDRCALWGIYKD